MKNKMIRYKIMKTLGRQKTGRVTKNDTEPSEGTVRRAVLESDPKDNTDLAKVLSEEAGKANPSLDCI